VHVSVVGGGIIGLSIGWYLIREGVEVTVFDKGEAGMEATWASAGMLAPNLEAEPGEEWILPLLLEGIKRWPSFAEKLEGASGVNVGYRTEGTMAVALNRDDVEYLHFLHDYQKKVGLEVKWLYSEDVLELEPNLSRNVLAGLFSPSDHQVDSRLVASALKKVLKDAGVNIKEYCKVSKVIVEDGVAKGVIANGEKISSDYVVLAAGAWSRQIEGIPEKAKPPVRPVKGQMLSLKMPENSCLLTHVVWGPMRTWGMVYLVPKIGNRIIVGATVEETGFDKTVTAGGLMNLLRGAWELLPTIYDLPVEEIWAGLRPGSPDDAPVIGPTGIHGLLLATGHYRNGILLAPITAEAISYYIVEGRLPPIIERFTIKRFYEGGV